MLPLVLRMVTNMGTTQGTLNILTVLFEAPKALRFGDCLRNPWGGRHTILDNDHMMEHNGETPGLELMVGPLSLHSVGQEIVVGFRLWDRCDRKRFPFKASRLLMELICTWSHKCEKR